VAGNSNVATASYTTGNSASCPFENSRAYSSRTRSRLSGDSPRKKMWKCDPYGEISVTSLIAFSSHLFY
jgi:hypothetical protein